MNYSHETLREAIGAYVLGQLEGDLLGALEDHLRDCDACRAEVLELRPLAAPLREISPDAVSDAAVPKPPPGLDLRVRRALAAEGRASRGGAARRRLPMGVAAGLGAAAASLAFVLFAPEAEEVPPGPPIETVATITEAPGVDVASAGLINHTWGIEINLVASGLRAGAAYDVVVIDTAGREHTSGAFVGVGADPLTCKMTSAVVRADASAFEVRDSRGHVVIKASLGPPPVA